MTGEARGEQKPVNYHEFIRNLVVDGSMRYQDVLDLTSTQISALLTKESTPPGFISEEQNKEFMKE